MGNTDRKCKTVVSLQESLSYSIRKLVLVWVVNAFS
jgi:hypothetical protein